MIIVLTVLAIARVTRLITTDHVFDTQRNWLVAHVMREGHEEAAWRVLVAYLIFCPWCMSMYVAASVACAYAVWGETMPYMTVVLALAASHVTGFLASKEGEG